ncbi:MAG: ATP-binding protein [Oscillospiraceae bacterium]|nr:ATP-binding protein [Oscillospiraceae bacterium]
MSKKIFNSIWLVALAVLLASLVFIMGVTYSYFSGVQASQLRIETELAAKGVSLNGLNYFDGLSQSDYRITWIDRDGTVLYDSKAEYSEMENHLEREEVKQALETGFGESSRYSETLSERLLYAAQLLPDGTVIRLSSVHNTVWTLLLGFAQPIAIVALLALALSFVLASRASKKIVEPINGINPDKPSDYIGRKDYAEIEPLLLKMRAQQAEISKNQAELEKTSQIRQEFTANASHELKTPLHAISGYAELLENGMVKQSDIRPFAGKIRLEAQRMTQLVGDIIDLTRLDGGADGMQWEESDLKRIAENAADSLQSAAAENGIELTVTGEEALISGIPQVLYSIVYNLCDNAIKYNHPGGGVRVAVANEPNAVRLTVSDTGIGISEEHQSRIFERFYRVDKSRSKEVGGTGLGLSIVKHGLIIHKAKLELDSTLDKGTTFTIHFPKT